MKQKLLFYERKMWHVTEKSNYEKWNNCVNILFLGTMHPVMNNLYQVILEGNIDNTFQTNKEMSYCKFSKPN